MENKIESYSQELVEEICIRFRLDYGYNPDGVLFFSDNKIQSLVLHLLAIELYSNDVIGRLSEVCMMSNKDQMLGYFRGWKSELIRLKHEQSFLDDNGNPDLSNDRIYYRVKDEYINHLEAELTKANERNKELEVYRAYCLYQQGGVLLCDESGIKYDKILTFDVWREQMIEAGEIKDNHTKGG